MIFILVIPEHVGIIPDGNRRLAKRLMKKPYKGHEWGLEKIKKVLEWCEEVGIKVMTFYVLSLENLEKRPKRELDFLFSLARKEIENMLREEDHVLHKNRVKVSFFGRLDLLPKGLQEVIRKLTERTKDYSNYSLNLAIAYGGRQEIVDASKRIALKAREGVIDPEKIDESMLRSYLWTNGFPDPDLILRTGGEKRVSNFLPFQSTYSELVFLDKFWPELEKEDFLQAVREFGERQRRFGK
ncbi:MAG: di-trans,poly-cis-decaprenylcistransferase [Candidatus Aenigmatarchaeota archaeon]|nr:MAG: di-trans,poly-cis-decaprenylcistransferase [Candidatus Aenigmarchaeota archaeon]